MKTAKIFLLILMILTLSVTSFAGWKETYTELQTPAPGDLVLMVDIDDFTLAPTGTTKYIVWGNMELNIPLPVNTLLDDATGASTVDFSTYLHNRWIGEGGQYILGMDSTNNFEFTTDGSIIKLLQNGDAQYVHGETVLNTDSTLARNADSSFKINEKEIKVPGTIMGAHALITSTTDINLPLHWSGTVYMTGAGTVGFPDCYYTSATDNSFGEPIEVITRTTSQVSLGIYGDPVNDFFRLKAGTALDPNDEADLPTTGWQRFICECAANNEWYIKHEDGTVTDGGGSSCSLYDIYATGTNWAAVGQHNDMELLGTIITPTENKTICSMRFFVEEIVGDVDDIDYYGELWTLDGSNGLDTLVGRTDAVDGADVTTNENDYQTFPMSTPAAVTASTEYAMLFKGVAEGDDPDTDPAAQSTTDFIYVARHGAAGTGGSMDNSKIDIDGRCNWADDDGALYLYTDVDRMHFGVSAQ